MGYWKRFLEWQNYAHYALLALWVYIWHALPWNEIVEQMYIRNPILGFIPLLLWWTLGLLIGDSIVHVIFYILPEPYRWRD